MNGQRRVFLKAILAGGAVVAVLGAGQPAQAARPVPAFQLETADEVLRALTRGGEIGDSRAVILETQEVAENAALVPVSVRTDLKNVESISVIVTNNPRPLAARFRLPEGTEPEVSIRVKLSETSEVVAVVEAEGRFYAARKEVRVTTSGCAG